MLQVAAGGNVERKEARRPPTPKGVGSGEEADFGWNIGKALAGS